MEGKDREGCSKKIACLSTTRLLSSKTNVLNMDHIYRRMVYARTSKLLQGSSKGIAMKMNLLIRLYQNFILALILSAISIGQVSM
jgi:hypothetical protein